MKKLSQSLMSLLNRSKLLKTKHLNGTCTNIIFFEKPQQSTTGKWFYTAERIVQTKVAILCYTATNVGARTG